MRISFVAPSVCEGGALAVFTTEGPVLTSSARALDEASGGLIGRALSSQRFQGRLGETWQIRAPADLKASRIVLVGLGPADAVDASSYEQAGGALAAALALTGECLVTAFVEDALPAVETGEAA